MIVKPENLLYMIGYLVFLASSISAANESCPNNLSQNCKCISDQSELSIKCTYTNGIADKLLGNSGSSEGYRDVSINKLDISSNGISSLPSDFYQGIKQISNLDMSKNDFESIPSEISTLNMSVLSLDLSHCHIKSIKLNKIDSLENLNLSSNSIQSLDIDTFRNVPGLKSLDLSSNRLTSLPEGLFSPIHSFHVLNLSGNKIQTIDKTIFDNLQNSLRTLHLENNNITFIHPDAFKSFNKLKTLNLSKNRKISTLYDINFPLHLSYLDLSECNLQQINDCKFRKLIDLEFLNLNGNQIPCSCHVTWLYQWISENKDSDPFHEKIEMVPWQCHQNGNQTIDTKSENLCEDHSPLPGHCDKVFVVAMTTVTWELGLDVTLDEDTLIMNWTPTNGTLFYGYKVKVTNLENGKTLKSAFLHKSASEFLSRFEELKSGEFSICLQILNNKTSFIHEECKEMRNSSLQIVVGILAGVVFLIPCIIALIYIVKKDRLYNQLLGYREIYKDQDIEKVDNSKVIIKITEHSSVKQASHERDSNSGQIAVESKRSADDISNHNVKNVVTISETVENKTTEVLKEKTKTETGQTNPNYVPDLCETAGVEGSKADNDKGDNSFKDDNSIIYNVRL